MRKATWLSDPKVKSRRTLVRVATGRSRRMGEEDELGMLDLLLSSLQELLHTTPASCKLVPRVWGKSI
ncbi:hypothetical protein Taro_017876 [Colocasia esculenta]|uniref:Uncharacterized protein n=1 Tax=Colocasia esculenta TaxID=4460 RepID=A0A843UP98_COLES|nr:hypothetical protein [Colocasia esculenta]